MRGWRRTTITLGLAAALLLTAVSSASATLTFTRSGSVITVTGDDGPNRIGNTSGDLFTSNSDTLVPGAGCAFAPPPYDTYVECGNLVGATVVINLLGGDDFSQYTATDPDRVVDGGPGNDELIGSLGKDKLIGGDGNDTVDGRNGADEVDGGPGNDTVNGGSGNDQVTGGAGVDNITGDDPSAFSGDGNDTIYARDGESDAIQCGFGADLVQGDANDRFDASSDCETRDLTAAATTPSGGGTPGAGGAGTGAAPLTVGLGKPGKLALGALAKGKKLKFTVTFSGACTAVVGLIVSKAEAKRLKLAKKEVVIARGVDQVTQAGTFSAALTIRQAYRAKLRKAKSLKATLALVCSDASGAQPETQRSVTFRR